MNAGCPADSTQFWELMFLRVMVMAMVMVIGVKGSSGRQTDSSSNQLQQRLTTKLTKELTKKLAKKSSKKTKTKAPKFTKRGGRQKERKHGRSNVDTSAHTHKSKEENLTEMRA